MDAAALSSLLTAFSLAPTADLGRIIVHAQLERQDYSNAAATLKIISTQLGTDERGSILGRFASANQLQVLDSLLHSHSSDAQGILEALVEEDRPAAQSLYLHWSNLRPELISTFWHNRLQLTQPGNSNSIHSANSNVKQTSSTHKSHLHLVDMPSANEVTHLSDYRQATVSFKDVVGLEEVKAQIHKKIILPFHKPGFFQRFKKKAGGGVLLYGPPGCGKTLIARATAGQCSAQFFNIQAADVLDMHLGESEQKLRAIFARARAEKPCIVFFDEFEALAGKRDHLRNSTSANLVSQFLAELDGAAASNEGVLILASTNVPWAIDAAFLRPGRFDRMFFVPPPDKLARAAILRHHMQDRPQDDDIDFESIASRLPGHSGADLANLVELAADQAIDDSLASETEVNISARHFTQALSEARNSTSEWLTTARNYARYANDGGRYDEVLAFLQRHGK